MAKDYYSILGVGKNATEAEIKAAYRKLAHQHHPDKNGGTDAKFKEINEAYQVLGDQTKRTQYDQFGQTFSGAGGQGFQGNPFGGFGGFAQGADVDFDLGDIFSSFFSGGDVRTRTRTRRGVNIQVDLEISLREAVFGTSRTLSLRKHNSCPDCSGSGAAKNSSFSKCPTCDGSGHITATVLGTFRTQTICIECEGEGKIIKDKCHRCGGGGNIDENVDIKVEIPGGIDDGQAIRLTGQGNSGKRGAGAGDLYVNIRIRPEPDLERQGNNLISNLEIPFTTAALGGSIEVRTIDGFVNLKIPAGTPSGKQFILKNKGVTKLRSRGRGDQIVVTHVAVPTKLSKKQKKLLEELDQDLNG